MKYGCCKMRTFPPAPVEAFGCPAKLWGQGEPSSHCGPLIGMGMCGLIQHLNCCLATVPKCYLPWINDKYFLITCLLKFLIDLLQTYIRMHTSLVYSPDAFSPAEHTCVTRTRIKTQNVTSTTVFPPQHHLLQVSPLSPVVTA